MRPAIFFLALGVLVHTPAFASWPISPLQNLEVAKAQYDQMNPVIDSDGAGGAIVVWQDARTLATGYDIYAQHLLATGVVDPAWPANGRALCTAADHQEIPVIVADGTGGAIVAWKDFRAGGNYNIYAQHLLATGVVDPAWPANGRALCATTAQEDLPAIVSDGAGGAIVCWQAGTVATLIDIYAQHVLASGAVDPAWPANGRVLCAAAGHQQYPKPVSDGAGGAIVSWNDSRSGNDVYAQRVLASGAVDPAWPVDGRALCTATGDQLNPSILTDGVGGAIVAWQDRRSGTSYDVYAQRVLASGVVDPAWPANGRALCTAANHQEMPVIVADGVGGAIVAWLDQRSGTSYDVYAQRVLASGAVDPAWPADGRAVCTESDIQIQELPTIVTDGVGGAIVCWHDYRSGTHYDVYAQRVLATGAVDADWPVNGRAVCTAANRQWNPTLVADGAGGAIVTWDDLRSGSSLDVYAQRVERHGYLGNPEAEIIGVHDVPGDQGGQVTLSWTPSYLDPALDANLAAYDIYRAVPAGGPPYAWEFLQSVAANHVSNPYSVPLPTTFDSLGGSNPKTAFLVQARNAGGSITWPSRPDSGYSVDNLAPAAPASFTGEYASGTASLHWSRNTEADLAGYRLYRGSTAEFAPGPGNLVAALPDTGCTDAPGSASWYKLTAVDSHGNESPVATLWPTETLAVPGAAQVLSFAAPMPNPTGGRTMLRYALPRPCDVRLAVYDAAGRQVRELVHGARGVGEHAAVWDLRDARGRAVAAGLYFVRFEAAGRTLAHRVTVAR